MTFECFYSEMQIIKESIDALKTPIDTTKREYKMVYASTAENDNQLSSLVENLSEEWTSLRSCFSTVQEKWLKNKETWHQFNSRYKRFSNWLDSIEANMKECSENGRLQLSMLKKKIPVNSFTLTQSSIETSTAYLK